MTPDSQPSPSVGLSARDTDLRTWLAQILPCHLPADASTAWQLQPLSGDAGFRRYYRVYTDGYATGLLTVDAPPATENTPLFVDLAHFLSAGGIRTPRILEADQARGFLLIEDLGDQLLQYQLTTVDAASALYGQSLMTLLRLQQLTPPTGLIESYDRAWFRRELQLFIDWFINALLGIELSVDEQALLDKLFTHLEDSALEQPRVFVHRDYHSRNLLVCDNGELGVIDFQGALLGPCTYDPVSLLRDCYLRWPSSQVRRWALGYGNLAYEAGVIPAVDATTWLRWFDWMGLQRHLKVLGIFSRLWLRDHRPHYLGDLSRVLGYVLEVTARYRELSDVDSWLRQRLLPIVKTQDWYRMEDLVGDSFS